MPLPQPNRVRPVQTNPWARGGGGGSPNAGYPNPLQTQSQNTGFTPLVNNQAPGTPDYLNYLMAGWNVNPTTGFYKPSYERGPDRNYRPRTQLDPSAAQQAMQQFATWQQLGKIQKMPGGSWDYKVGEFIPGGHGLLSTNPLEMSPESLGGYVQGQPAYNPGSGFVPRPPSRTPLERNLWTSPAAPYAGYSSSESYSNPYRQTGYNPYNRG